MRNTPKILFVDDEEHLRNAVSQAFGLAEISHECFASAQDVLPLITRNFDGILISDIRMPSTSGIDLMANVLEIDNQLPVILVTGHGDIKIAVQAIQDGAYNFIEKPFDPRHLVEVAKRALETRKLTLENRALRDSINNQDMLETRFAGQTPLIQNLRDVMRSIAASDIDLLISGETGVGKEAAARAVHDLSERRDAPFIAVNCGAISDDQMESELLGHEQGAFVGAIRARYGKLEHARGGTVFLDEISEASPKLQAMMIRVIEERAFSRLGGSQKIDLNVRFIASTCHDLQALSAQSEFSTSLYHRLSASILAIPPLSERTQDIPRLFTQLTNEAVTKYRRAPVDIPSHVFSRLMARKWLGNVRELKNTADRYVLGLEMFSCVDEEVSMSAGKLSDRLAAVEKEIVSSELKAQNGVLRNTHEALGISRKSLYEKMQKHGITKEDFKSRE